MYLLAAHNVCGVCDFQGESVDLVLYLPEICTSRSVLLALDANAKLYGHDVNLRQRNDGARKWRNVCQRRQVIILLFAIL